MPEQLNIDLLLGTDKKNKEILDLKRKRNFKIEHEWQIKGDAKVAFIRFLENWYDEKNTNSFEKRKKSLDEQLTFLEDPAKNKTPEVLNAIDEILKINSVLTEAQIKALWAAKFAKPKVASTTLEKVQIAFPLPANPTGEQRLNALKIQLNMLRMYSNEKGLLSVKEIAAAIPPAKVVSEKPSTTAPDQPVETNKPAVKATRLSWMDIFMFTCFVGMISALPPSIYFASQGLALNYALIIGLSGMWMLGTLAVVLIVKLTASGYQKLKKSSPVVEKEESKDGLAGIAPQPTPITPMKDLVEQKKKEEANKSVVAPSSEERSAAMPGM